MWDLFISHASDDKAGFVNALAEELQRSGLNVWYDQTTLKLGDSLRRKIDEGLAQSRFGVVVLSKSFFAKNWPQKELDGLAAREDLGRKVILPIWHGIGLEEVARYSPTLADRLAISTDKGLAAVVREILEAVGSPTAASQAIASSKIDAAVTIAPIVSQSFEPNPNSCVVILDGTPFSSELLAIVEESGFRTTRMAGTSLPFTRAGWDDDIGDSGLVVLVRGEHFQGGSNPEFYRLMHDFIAAGGFVFATPWVSWETQLIPIVRNFLPFEHPGGGYSEATPVVVQYRGTKLEFQASIEHLGAVSPGGTVLLSSIKDVPIFGTREYGQGCCIYLNACQHSCAGSMPSPLQSKELRHVIAQTFVDARAEMKTRRNRRRHSPRAAALANLEHPFAPSWF